VDSCGMQEHYCPRWVTNGMHRKIHDALAAVSHPVSKLFAKNEPRSSLIRREANPCLHLFRTTPPRSVPEWSVQNLLPGVSARFHGQFVHFSYVALQVQDACE